jgi:hypothetical protein
MVSDVPTHAALTRAGADQLAERWRPSAAREARRGASLDECSQNQREPAGFAVLLVVASR